MKHSQTTIAWMKSLALTVSAALIALVLVSSPMLELWHAQAEMVYAVSSDAEENQAPVEFSLQAPNVVVQASVAKVPQSIDADIQAPQPPAHLQQRFEEKTLFVPILRFSQVLFRHILATNAP